MWVLQVLMELVGYVFEDKKDLFLAGINMDLENIKKPVTEVGNFFKKVTGQQIPPEDPPTKEEKMLEKRVQRNKAKEEEAKLSKKEAKKAAKDAERAAKKADKEAEQLEKFSKKYNEILKRLEEEEKEEISMK